VLLNCHTYYSFGYGALSLPALLAEVKAKGYYSMVISDINNTSAILEGIRLAAEKSIKAIPGIDFRNNIDPKYIGIAQNNFGFKELNEHLSKHLHSNIPFEAQAPAFYNAFVVYPFEKYKGWTLRENEFIGIAPHQLLQLPFSPAKNYVHKLVVLQTVTFVEKKDFNAHRLLRAINENVLLSKLPNTLQASEKETMMSRNDLYRTYGAHPQAIRNTEYILQNSNINFEYGKFANKNLKYYTHSLADDMELLRVATEQGMRYRYGKIVPDKVRQRVHNELTVIEQMNFAAYFLINWDIVKYAQHKDYYYVGRGSGANSMVAYLLRITDVDPIELDLYFERFINPHRSNPPDFDIDFAWTDRGDITRYIFDRFGKERTSLLATYNTFQHDGVIRELGKVFGLPPQEIDRLQRITNINEADHIGQLVLRYSHLLHGMPSHLSIHSSGILISEEPTTTYSATFLPPKGYPTTQFSMLEAEDIGLYKFDILGQRGLAKIKDAVTIIKQNKGVSIDIHDIPKFKTDETVKKLLSLGQCIGCFYIESPAMRMLLAKLQASDYLRLVAASSIIRPGVSKSGMMREYILRFRDEKKRVEAQQTLPELYEILKETYGVMVYQEDVIKVGHMFAGLTLAEADYLRRGMSWKFKQRNEFDRVQENFFKNCLQKGYAQKTIADIWMQIESFANYAFSKGHSASYAVESYQALYLKAYHPLEYMVATINNGGGFYRMEFYVHEARMHGAIIEAPCINNSQLMACIKDKTIYLGLSQLASLEATTAQQIIEERNLNGIFTSLANFVQRIVISIDQIRILIRAGAFKQLDTSKKKLLWEVHSLINPLQKKDHKNELFALEQKEFKLPQLQENWIDDAFDEIELIGFALCHPFKLLREEVHAQLRAKNLHKFINQKVEIIGYLCTVKPTSTSKGERMCFGTFIDIDGDWIDTTHFPPSLKQYPFAGPGCYRLMGKVVNEFDHISIEIDSMYRLTTINRDDGLVVRNVRPGNTVKRR
jgi:DNA polymerase III subunit alpha